MSQEQQDEASTTTTRVANTLAEACDAATQSTAGFGTMECVLTYLQRNAPRGAEDVTRFRDNEERTALHWAVALKNFELASALLYGPYKQEAIRALSSTSASLSSSHHFSPSSVSSSQNQKPQEETVVSQDSSAAQQKEEVKNEKQEEKPAEEEEHKKDAASTTTTAKPASSSSSSSPSSLYGFGIAEQQQEIIARKQREEKERKKRQEEEEEKARAAALLLVEAAERKNAEEQDAKEPIHWALPPDANGTSVLATACAVSAPFEFVRDLIWIVSGTTKISEELVSGGSSQVETSVTSTSTSAPVAAVGPVFEVSKTAPQPPRETGSVRDLFFPVHPLIDRADVQGNTPMHLAASRGNMKLVKLLLACGSDPRRQNKRGQTTLHRLVSRSNEKGIEFLVAFARKNFLTGTKSFINMTDTNGDSALHYASMEENRDIGEFLLRHGAVRDAKNKQGKEFWEM